MLFMFKIVLVCTSSESVKTKDTRHVQKYSWPLESVHVSGSKCTRLSHVLKMPKRSALNAH